MTLDATAEAVREHHRHADGTFGKQHHTHPELTLGQYRYPVLKNGLHPALIQLYPVQVDGEWSVTAHEILFGDGEGVRTSPDSLIHPIALPLTDEQAAEVADTIEIACTLDEAPAWLRDAVLPSLVDWDARARETDTWKKDRHDEMTAAGAFATTWDNEYITDFEHTFPSNMPLDAAAGLFDMEELPDGDPSFETERELAAAELSRRAAHGMGGILTDIRELRAGDQISLAHLSEHIDFDTAELHTVTATDTWGDIAKVQLEGGRYVHFPTGARVPTAGYEVDGQEVAPGSLVKELVATGAISYRSKGDPHAGIVARYNTERGLTPGDDGYITPLTPNTTGATL
ncbi:hypothetical protein [Microbacterium sp. 77mftsu3.1]|uniref:hypothetical protein n=1 Tax=Microbacterium sp. 77mftsu3.1 TaxID=1761802 RepID=UPI000380FCB0|nr:hypothetical protein [Microbacterium sp. 77mftsu3.1]SDH35828.1 hypothetical protein SAMN04488590_3122 [Microbacterium sp. 77mftsu3.1]